MDSATNLQSMKKLDDSWNGQDLQTFRKYHAKDCIVRWPNQPPTHGVDAHEQEAIAFFKTFPDQHLVNNPYKIMLSQGEWTCTVADFTGTMTGSMKMPGGTVIQPTNKSFHIVVELAKKMKKLKPSVPIVLFSGSLPERLDGVDVYINKGESTVDFLRIMRDVVERSCS